METIALHRWIKRHVEVLHSKGFELWKLRADGRTDAFLNTIDTFLLPLLLLLLWSSSFGALVHDNKRISPPPVWLYIILLFLVSKKQRISLEIAKFSTSLENFFMSVSSSSSSSSQSRRKCSKGNDYILVCIESTSLCSQSTSLLFGRTEQWWYSITTLFEAVILKSSWTGQHWTFLVHYLGWNARWDKWLDETCIFPDTPEIRTAATRIQKEQVCTDVTTDNRPQVAKNAPSNEIVVVVLPLPNTVNCPFY